MSDDDFNALISELEARSYKYDFQIADAFREINNENETNASQSEILESNFIAFRFMTRNDDDKRFKPVAEYTNGAVFPDEKTEVTQDRLDYWLERAEATINPIMRARYYDLNYEFNNNLDKVEVARKTVQSYIAASKVEGLGNEMDIIDSVTRAFLLALKYKEQSPDVFVSARDNLVSTINRFASDNLRWCLELIEVVVEHHDDFSDEQILEIKNLTDKGVEYYQNIGDSFMILESYLKVNREMTVIATPDEYDADVAVQANAQLYIDEADSRVDSLFVQQMHLLQAEKILRDGGLNAEANKIHGRIEAMAKDPEFASNFQAFQFEQAIPQEEIDKLIESFDKAEDKGQLLAFAPVFMPSWKASKKSGTTEQYASISDIVKSVTLNEDNMPIARAPENPKLRRTMRYYDASVQTSGAILVLTVSSALKAGKFNLEDVMPQLEKIKSINEKTYNSVLLGFEYFFEGKYFEALSILLPQIEDLMADVMVGMGISRYRQRDEDLVEYKTLGPILSALKKSYGDDIYHFLHYKLIDEGKENLRNFNGHGKLKVDSPNLDQKAMSVIQAYMCVLAPLNPLHDKPEQKNPTD